jgi:hypothetical protein
MKSIKIYIETENAAFHPEPGREVARILRKIADEIEVGGVSTPMDINGNKIGKVELNW